MTKEELREKMYKDLNEVFNVNSIINFQFDLMQKAYTKGLETGLKAGRPQWHGSEEHIDKDKVVLGHIKLCNKDRYSLVQWNGEWWYQYGTFNAEVRLIEWCEIPTFDKE